MATRAPFPNRRNVPFVLREDVEAMRTSANRVDVPFCFRTNVGSWYQTEKKDDVDFELERNVAAQAMSHIDRTLPIPSGTVSQ